MDWGKKNDSPIFMTYFLILFLVQTFLAFWPVFKKLWSYKFGLSDIMPAIVQTWFSLYILNCLDVSDVIYTNEMYNMLIVAHM